MRKDGCRTRRRDRGRRGKVLALAVAAVLAAGAVALGVTAARADINSPENIVSTVSPSGTTINVFDYWRGDYDHGRSGDDTQNPTGDFDDWSQAGINEDHTLKFGNNMRAYIPDDEESKWANANRGGNEPVTGIVAGELGDDGYPVLSGGDVVKGSNESLAYLFNQEDDPNSKKSFANVQGLLKVENGYYVYDAKQNFAQFNEDTNSFTVYNAWGVSNHDETANDRDGQFFLFNDAEKDHILTEKDGTLSDSGTVKSNSSELNHYFGLTMSTQFVQQHDGYTDDTKNIPVTYNFSGDDDVWVYIDGYLVGDLGGIHSACALDIDFSTGNVVVFKDKDLNNDYNSGDEVLDRTTLREMMEKAAGSDREVAPLFQDDTSRLKNGTYHTLDFFYMERGNTDSNMSLKFNLQSIPETDITKVDQDEDPVSGATFEVTDTNTGELICTATTGADGSVVLMQPESHTLITPDWLSENNHREITLTETTVPDGYRATKPIKLRVESLETNGGGTKNVLLVNNQWESGAYAQPKLMATAPQTLELDTGTKVESKNIAEGEGKLFAVIQQKGSDGKWYTVTGDAIDGWRLTNESGVEGATSAAAADSRYEFEIGSSGNLEAMIERLPGNIQDYEYFTGDKFRGAYYYTDANNTTYEVTNTNQFDRQFSAKLYVSDVINRVIVQKTDEGGNPLDGAEIGLYEEDQVTANGDGTYSLIENATPIQSQETRTLTESNDRISLEGAVVFSGLESGTYYVGEVSAPNGYARSNAAAKVTVNESGVYADAGIADDGVTVTRGVGRVLRSMVQFASDDHIDVSLHDIVATPQTGEPTSGNWTNVQGAQPLHLEFDDEGNKAALDYVATEGTGSEQAFTVDEGTPNLSIKQCDTHIGDPRTNLGDTDITGLFTGSTIVHLKNEPVGALTISKSVQGEDADSAQQFSFQVSLTDADGAPLSGTFQAQTYSGDTPEGDAFTVENGSTVTLRSGERVVIKNIGEGNKFSVTEGASEGYLTVASLNGSDAEDASPDDGFTVEGTIPSGSSSEVAFTNTRFDTDDAKDVFAANESNQKSGDSIDGQPVQVGSLLYYEITWVNPEASSADVVVSDTVPTGTEFVTAANGGTQQGNTVTWNLGEQAPGATGTVSFVVRVTDDALGQTVDNGASISVGQNNPAITTNTTHNPVPGKSVSSTTAEVGDVLTYTITYDNVQEGATVVVSDALDEGLTFFQNTTDESVATFSQDENDPQQLSWTIENAEAGTITITFTAKVNEKAVADTGSLPNEAAVKVGDGPAVSTNETETQTQTGALVVRKVVQDASGQPTTADQEFTFNVSLADVSDSPLTGTYRLVTTDDAGTSSRTLDLDEEGKATFTLKGGQTATISGLPEGSTYVVSENDYSSDGYMTTSTGNTTGAIATGDTTVEFTNKQTSASLTLGAEGTVPLTKTLQGRDWMGPNGSDDGDEFTFSLTGEAEQGSPTNGFQLPTTQQVTVSYKDAVQAAGEGSSTQDVQVPFEFDPITFTKPGTYTFTVSEGSVDEEGVTAKTESITFTFNVTPDSNEAGGLKVELAADSPTRGDFVNVYQRTEDGTLDTVDFGLTKTYAGPWTNGRTFTFELTGTDGEGNPAPMPQDSNGNDVTEATLSQGQFNGGNKASFDFGTITYTEPGSYTYTVTEQGAGTTKDGVTYSNNTAVFTVSVTDNLHGGLTVVVAKQSGDTNFENTYAALPVSTQLTALKTVNGKNEGIEAGAFTFQVTNKSKPQDVETAPMPSLATPGEDVSTVKNDVDGTINFGTLEFAKPGEYTYEVREVNGGAKGYTYDSSVYTVTYDVVDNHEGSLVVTGSTITKDGAPATEIVFANTYQPASTITGTHFSGRKTVTEESGNYTLAAGDFTFEMKSVGTTPDGISAPTPSNGTQVTNDTSGDFDFGTLTFEKPGTYTYEVHEVAGSKAGISYDGTVYTVVITVDDKDGALAVTGQTVTKSDGTAASADALDFNNIYDDHKTSVTITGNKVLSTNGYAGESLEDGEYTFVLVDQSGKTLETVNKGSSNNTGTFSFDPITFDEAGTYTYTVYELGADGEPGTGGTKDHVTYSTEAYTVTIKVTSDHDGRGLKQETSFSKAGTSAESIVFTNDYQPGETTVGPSGTTRIEGTKTLDGRALQEGEFEFGLYDASGKQIATASNAADGSFVFGDITYDEQGTYAYTVREIDGGLGGVTYDKTAYDVTVTVTENVDTDTLEAAVSYKNAANGNAVQTMTFENTYTASPVAVTLGGTKRLAGCELADGEFSFQLSDPDTGKVLQTVSNDSEGGFAFEDQVFGAPGTYRYNLSEVLPEDDDPSVDGVQKDGVTYDQTTYAVEVTVADNGSGQLAVTGLTYNGKDELPVFTNTYNEPAETPTSPAAESDEPADSQIPQTSDITNRSLPLVLALAGVAIVIGVVVAIRRGRE